MAADTFQIKRGTTAAVNAYLPALGEPVYDITLKQLRLGDGVTLGGVLAGSPTSAYIATLLDDANAADALLTLGAAPLASPAFTGVPTAPTAGADTNTLQVASTAFVLGQAASVAPIVDGVAAVGTSLRYARQDHVHPTDTSRAPLASPALTGVPTAPTAAIGTNTTQLANMAALQARILGTVSQSGGVPTGTIIDTATNANGTYTKWADGTMICTRTVSLGSVSISTVGGAIFYQTFGAIPFAATFSAAPVVQMSAISSGGLAWVAMGSALPSTTATQAYFVVVPVSGTYTVSVQLTATGRWF